MNKQPKICPSCSSHLLVTRLTCPQCNTEVSGAFQPDLFARLAPNDFDFVVLFLKSKGNIKEMERELGISYWTIRSKLGEIVHHLGLSNGEDEEEPSELAERRQQILEQLNGGLITVQEAAALLEKLKRKP